MVWPFQTSSRIGTSNPFSQPAESSDELWQRLQDRRPAPLRFVLHLSRRPNASLCPCLQVDLPSRTDANSSYTVVRILDPEHRIPYISLSPILFSAGLTLIQGLLRFNIAPISYDLSLSGLEPWDDAWISLPLARRIASELDLLPALAAILDGKTSLAWSLDEFEQGLSHNWRVPQQFVDSTAYSTNSITDPELKFAGVLMLPQGQQVKTLVSAELRGKIILKAEHRRRENTFRLHQKLARWSSQVITVWSDVRLLLGTVHPTENGGAEDGRAYKLKALLEDLQQVSAHLTSVDMLEWMQLCSASSFESESLHPTPDQRLPGERTDNFLSPLSLAELCELRTIFGRSDSFPMPTGVEDIEETLTQFGSILRAKLISIHHMNLLSLHLLSKSFNESKAGRSWSDLRYGSEDDILPTSTANQHPDLAARDQELIHLHTKIDNVTTKLDALMQTHTSNSFSQNRVKRATPREVRATVNALHPHEAGTDGNTAPKPILVEPPRAALTKMETTPSLTVTIISLALFFALIKSSVD